MTVSLLKEWKMEVIISLGFILAFTFVLIEFVIGTRKYRRERLFQSLPAKSVKRWGYWLTLKEFDGTT